MYQATTEADLKAHYGRIKQRLNIGLVPKPINENPARSDRSLGQARLESTLAGAETCGVASKVKEWVSAQDYIPPYRTVHSAAPNKIKTILRATCQHFGLPMTDILSSERTWSICRPRQIAMYLSKIMTGKAYTDIGRQIGGRDRTTILFAVRKITALVQSDQQLAADVAAIRALAVAADPGLGA